MPIAAACAVLAVSAQPIGFVSSVQTWTFNKFTAVEAVAKVAGASGKYIEFYPGQKVTAALDAGMGPDMGEQATAAVKAALNQYGVTPVAFGVTDIPTDKAAARKLFAWAKSFGIMVINTESAGSLDTIEAMVKEFDIKVGFHDHPKRANDPNYRMWDPNYILSLVKNRDKRIGSCADTGHWIRSGIKPVDALRILKGRVVSSHLKDLNEFTPNGHDVPFGLGVSDMAGILDEFKKQGFNGPASVEYEYNWDNSIIDVAGCLGFVRGHYRG